MPPSPVDGTLRSDPQAVPILAWPALILAVACVAICLSLDADLWITLFTFVGCLVAAVTLTRHYTLDSTRRIVLQADLAFGRWPVAHATWPFERVAGVCTRISRDSDSGYQVRVGIRLRDGRMLWMKGFPSPSRWFPARPEPTPARSASAPGCRSTPFRADLTG